MQNMPLLKAPLIPILNVGFTSGQHFHLILITNKSSMLSHFNLENAIQSICGMVASIWLKTKQMFVTSFLGWYNRISNISASMKQTLLSQLTLAVRKTGDISCWPGATSLCFTAMGQPIFNISAWAMSNNSWGPLGSCRSDKDEDDEW